MEKHRRLVACDQNVGCLQKSVACLAEVCASQPVDHRSDVVGNDQLKDSAGVYLPAVKNDSWWNRSIAWVYNFVLPSIQTFQAHLVYYLCTMHQDNSELDLAQYLPFTDC